MEVATRPFGEHLRDWRRRRRMSQLDLALEAEVSARHLSFVETGRARPSREIVLHLCERLGVPLRERNLLLLAAGHAPVFPARALDDPSLAPARRAVDLVLGGHEPYPALAVDRHWRLVAANRAVAPLLAGVDPVLTAPPVNVLRLSLHPAGLAPRIINLGEWRAHLLARLVAQIEASGDAALVTLRDELAGYPVPTAARRAQRDELGGIAVPLRLESQGGPLALISTTTVFGTPVDVTLAELAIEAFFPADEATAARLAGLAAAGSEPG
jgi:transcriptional regulator with XRE-family HTH domain